MGTCPTDLPMATPKETSADIVGMADAAIDGSRGAKNNYKVEKDQAVQEIYGGNHSEQMRSA